MKYKRQRDICCVSVGSIRYSCPEQAKTRKIIQVINLNYKILNTGNPEKTKVIETELMLRNFFLNENKNNKKNIIFRIILLSNKTIKKSRSKNQDLKYRYGGKIIEKANAPGNFGDNISINLNIELISGQIDLFVYNKKE